MLDWGILVPGSGFSVPGGEALGLRANRLVAAL
jgi:hypothetical protein